MHAALWIIAFAAALVATGVLYQTIGSWHDRRVYASGRWVPIGNGARLYLFELGGGEPTVVFEAGIGATHLNWRRIQETIAENARAISYDRCGLGWSSRCRTARTPANIAASCTRCCTARGFKPPYVLVGHSFGGLVMRRFALLYPGEVAGVVLVDPMRCEEWPPLEPIAAIATRSGPSSHPLRVACGALRAGASAGHIAFRPRRQALRSDCQRRRRVIRAMCWAASRPKSEKCRAKSGPRSPRTGRDPDFYAGLRSHIDSIPATVTRNARGRAHPRPFPSPCSRREEPLLSQPINSSKSAIPSIRSLRRKSEHWIHLDEPDLVIGSIRAMLEVLSAETFAAAD